MLASQLDLKWLAENTRAGPVLLAAPSGWLSLQIPMTHFQCPQLCARSMPPRDRLLTPCPGAPLVMTTPPLLSHAFPQR